VLGLLVEEDPVRLPQVRSELVVQGLDQLRQQGHRRLGLPAATFRRVGDEWGYRFFAEGEVLVGGDEVGA
jgi:hypothetical protein